MPVMAHDLLESIRLLGKRRATPSPKNVCAGIKANEERCAELVELSMAMVTSLAPKIGYDRAAEDREGKRKDGEDGARNLSREKNPSGRRTERRARSESR